MTLVQYLERVNPPARCELCGADLLLDNGSYHVVYGPVPSTGRWAFMCIVCASEARVQEGVSTDTSDKP